MSDETPDPLVGQTLLNKLRVLRPIGEGGMGAVYEVEHTLTRHRRALKVLHSEFASSPEVVARFVREAGVAGTLRSKHVVETFDAGQLEDGSTYVLMELLDGQPLDALLEQRGRMDPMHVCRLIWDACEGVAAAHQAGIVHRDLKPENLFVVRDDDGRETVKLLDFGISKFSEQYDHSGSLTADGSMMGTPYYMSPEQAKGGAREVDGRADVYALGVILYEALSGVRPFEDPSFPALVIKIHQGDYEPLSKVAPDVDPKLAAVVERAMNVDADLRFPRVEELQDALRELVDEELPVRGSAMADPAVAFDDTMAPPSQSITNLPTPALGEMPPPREPKAPAATPTPGSWTGDGAERPAGRGTAQLALMLGGVLAVVGAVAVGVAVSMPGGDGEDAGAEEGTASGEGETSLDGTEGGSASQDREHGAAGASGGGTDVASPPSVVEASRDAGTPEPAKSDAERILPIREGRLDVGAGRMRPRMERPTGMRRTGTMGGLDGIDDVFGMD